MKRSKVFLGGRDCPKILLPVLDLIHNDPKWSQSSFTLQSLLKVAITNDPKIKTGQAKLHSSFYQNDDIFQNLQKYFTWFNLTLTEYVDNEDLILELLANHLKRKIRFSPILKPIYQRNFGKTFGHEFEETFDIFGHRNHVYSYYISALKVDQ